VLDALVYFIPYRNNVSIGELFSISLWFYFGILNAILLILVYTLVKGQVILDFSSKKLTFNEFKKRRSWDFTELLGIYLLAYEGEYLIRVRPKRLLTLDIQVGFEHAYKLLEKFEELGYKFKTIRSNEPKKITYPFPVLFSKFEKKSGGFNPEIPEWYRGITLRTKMISITIAPLLYVIGGTLIARMPYLVEGLSATRGIVYFIYVFTVFLLFDGGLYFLFGISFLVIIAKQIYKISSPSHSSDKQ
jgi:hypothetical protein